MDSAHVYRYQEICFTCSLEEKMLLMQLYWEMNPIFPPVLFISEPETSGQRLKPEMMKCPPSRAPVHTFHAMPGVMMLF